jgi:hypothetical protein
MMKNISFDVVAPYLGEPIRMNLLRFEALKTFFHEELGYKFFRASPVDLSSSSSKLSLTFTKDWVEVRDTSLEDNKCNFHFRIAVHISERGPFVISEGFELQPIPRHELAFHPSHSEWFAPSELSEKKAKEIAAKVAERFSLICLDKDWLGQFKLSEEDISHDALARLDFDEPSALNVLFAEAL